MLSAKVSRCFGFRISSTIPEFRGSSLAPFEPQLFRIPSCTPLLTARRPLTCSLSVSSSAGTSSSMDPSARGSSQSVQIHPASAIYENQRWLGVAWFPPMALLDFPSFSDAEGNPVILDVPPNKDPDPTKWRIVVSPATDREGWQYGTVFQHLSSKRPGGRASQRLGDAVRRRAWIRSDQKPSATAVEDAEAEGSKATPISSGGFQANERQRFSERVLSQKERLDEAAASAQRESAAKRRAVKSFIGMVMDLLSRKNFWDIVPWDPSAIPVIQKQHQAAYLEYRQRAAKHCLLGSDDPTPAPSVLTPNGTLLQDLLTAAVHSRAAYGFAMQAGHISSVSAYVRLHTLQPFSFDAVAGASEESNNEAISSLTGTLVEDILEASWKNSPYRPCHYVAIDRAARCVVVSIRGSLEVGDLLSDVSAHPMETSFGSVHGCVHQGMLASASYVQCATQAALEEAAAKVPGWPVLLTGHSLGGGVAALLSMLYKDAGGIKGLGPIRTIAIGPAAVVSDSLANSCRDDVISVVVGSDIIPRLSYASVERLLEEMVQASPLRRAAEDLGKKIFGIFGFGEGREEGALQTQTTSSTSTKASGTKTGAAASKDEKAWRLVRDAAGAERDATPAISHKHGLQELAVIAEDENERWKYVMEQKEKENRTLQEETESGHPSQTSENDRKVRANMIRVIDLNVTSADDRESNSEVDDIAMSSTSHTRSMRSRGGEGSGGPDVQLGGTHSSVQHSMAPHTSASNSDLLYCDPGPDGPLLSSAMARGMTSVDESDQVSTIPQTSVVDRASKLEFMNTSMQRKDPAILYPPGKIVWIFPSDESMVDSRNPRDNAPMPQEVARATESREEEEAGEGGDDVRKEGEHSVQGHRNEEKAQKGSAEELIDANGEDLERATDSAAAEIDAMWDRTWEGGPRPSFSERERSTGDVASGSTSKKAAPVAMEADREVFQRLLLLPDCFDDHLPDRYLEALRQL